MFSEVFFESCNNNEQTQAAKVENLLAKGIQVLVKMPKLTEKTKIPYARGCPHCNSTGYRGRIGIFEAVLIDDEIEKFILTSPSIVDLKEKAIKKGMVTMRQDGLIKALEGVTTLEEVEKITGE